MLQVSPKKMVVKFQKLFLLVLGTPGGCWKLDPLLDAYETLEKTLDELVRDKAKFECYENVAEFYDPHEIFTKYNQSQLGQDIHATSGFSHQFALDFSSSLRQRGYEDAEGAEQKKKFLVRYHNMLRAFAKDTVQQEKTTASSLVNIGRYIPDALLSAITSNPFSAQLWRIYREYKFAGEAYLSNKSLFDGEGLEPIFDATLRPDKEVSLKVAVSDANTSEETAERILCAEDVRSLGLTAATTFRIKFFSFDARQVYDARTALRRGWLSPSRRQTPTVESNSSR